jgi:hypothetical protein
MAGKLPDPRDELAIRKVVEMPIERVAGILEALVVRGLICDACGFAGDPQRMPGRSYALLCLVEQGLRHTGRVGAARELAPFAGEFGERGGFPFCLAEHGTQDFDDKFERRAIVTVKDKLKRPGIGVDAGHGNVLHEKTPNTT